MNWQIPDFFVPEFGSPFCGLDSCPLTQSLTAYLEMKTQAPRPLILISILASYSTLMQGDIDVERPGGGVGPVSLYTLGIAESGERKSAISSYLDRPIIAFQERELMNFSEDMLNYELEVELYENQKRSLTSLVAKKMAEGDSADDVKERLRVLVRQKPIKPLESKLLHEDATPESMAESLHAGYGLASLSSGEGGSILNGRIIQNMAMLNKLWAGESWSVSRKTSKSYQLANCRLSISILSQPTILWDFLDRTRSESRGIGFLARFLVCYPMSTQGTRFFNNGGLADEKAYIHYLSRADQILESVKSNMATSETKRKTITFTPQAADLWVRLYNFIEANVIEGRRFCQAKDLASKLAENIARIAALLCYMEQSEETAIDVGILKDAARLAFFFSDAFILNICGAPSWLLDDIALREFFQSKREDGLRFIRKSKVRRSGPYRIRKTRILDPALQRLFSNGEINLISSPTGMLVIDLFPGAPVDIQQLKIATE